MGPGERQGIDEDSRDEPGMREQGCAPRHREVLRPCLDQGGEHGADAAEAGVGQAETDSHRHDNKEEVLGKAHPHRASNTGDPDEAGDEDARGQDRRCVSDVTVACHFHDHAEYFRVAEIDGNLAGFVIALREGGDYESTN